MPIALRTVARPTAVGACVTLCTALAAACGDAGPDTPATGTPTITTTRAASTTTPAPTVDPYAGLSLIDHVEWAGNIDGPRLRVHPTRAGHETTFPGAGERAWQEVLALDPTVEAPGMRDQFICHWEWARLVAPDKPTWNLEPWRPAVGYDATVEAACNPGGPER